MQNTYLAVAQLMLDFVSWTLDLSQATQFEFFWVCGFSVKRQLQGMPLSVLLLIQGAEIVYGVTMAGGGGAGSPMPLFSYPK